jgi:phosphoenolpyruvate-protein kinase (PTS system EI component)
LPSISLLDILGKAGRNIGFVFQEGATLCHFAVILRELGIPAIVGVDINCLDYDEQYCLDTNTGASLEEKFKIYV